VIPLALLPGPSAFARANLVSADPPVGAIIAAAPATISLTFSEQVDAHFSTIMVLDERNQRVQQGAVEFTGYGARTLRIAVKPLAPGIYRVIWRAYAWDGSKSNGKFEFTIRP